MVVTVPVLLGSAGLIYVGCEFFVNGVEWVGRKLGIAQNAVGTVLAAFVRSAGAWRQEQT